VSSSQTVANVRDAEYNCGVAELAIRVPSVDALFDAWSVETLASRPLSDEARERIVDEWTRERKRATGAPTVSLRLPEAERREGLGEEIAGAVRHDMETMAVDSRRHWIRRSLRPRESRIGIALFVVAVVISALIDSLGGADSILSQTFVVLSWVALWGPAYRVITAASFRLARKRFAELAAADVRVHWDEG
jgi:hypothetical protein